MKRTIVVLAGLLILLALALSPGQPELFAALPAQNATPTPAAEHEHADDDHADDSAHAENASAEPTMADLLARLENLEATVAELSAAHEATHAASYDQVNAVNTAIYLLDAVGLHELDTQLAVDGVINPGDSGKVSQVARLLTTVVWPQELAGDASAIHDMLMELAAALADDDLETSKTVMLTGHATYHVFSQQAQDWMSAAVAGALADAPGQTNRVNTAIYLLDGAGLHGLDVRLNEDAEILPGDSGRVSQVARLLTTVDWPHDLVEDAATLYETLSTLAAALADDDLEAAQPLAAQAHEEQHALSHHAQAWLAEQMGADGAGHGDHSHDADHGEESTDEEAPAKHSHGG